MKNSSRPFISETFISLLSLFTVDSAEGEGKDICRVVIVLLYTRDCDACARFADICVLLGGYEVHNLRVVTPDKF